jgi:hypothetical protein
VDRRLAREEAPRAGAATERGAVRCEREALPPRESQQSRLL